MWFSKSRQAKNQKAAEADTKFEELTVELGHLRAELEQARRVPYRERLQDTRDSVTHKFSVAGHEGYITAGLYPDGRPAEIFIKMAKEGSTIGGLMDTIGILTSLCLQYGVAVENLASKFQHSRFEPSGHTKNPDLREAASLVDYIFTWLGLEFSEEFRRDHQARQTGPTVDESCATPASPNPAEIEDRPADPRLTQPWETLPTCPCD